MRLLIDVQSLQTGSQFRGIGRYTLSLVKELIRIGSDIEILLLMNDQVAKSRADGDQSDSMRELFGRDRIIEFPTLRNASYISNDESLLALAETVRHHFITAIDPTVLLTMSTFETEAITSIPPADARDYRAATILYDLIPLSDRAKYLSNDRARWWYERKLSHFRESDLILSISDHSRQDALAKLDLPPDWCVNISAACDLSPFQSVAGAASVSPGADVPADCILYVGAFDPRKNVLGLLRAYARLDSAIRDKHPLVLAGSISTHERALLDKQIGKLQLSKGSVIVPGFVSDDVLGMLYRTCRVFVFPSSNEGFGLPPLEAMNLGAPTIAARRASLVEVIGNDEALFDPDDVESFAATLGRAIVDEAFRRRLVTRANEQIGKFSWTRSAEAALRSIRELARSPHKRRAKPGSAASLFRYALGEPASPEADPDISSRTDLLARACAQVENLIASGIVFDRPGELNLKNTFLQSVPKYATLEAPYVFGSTVCREQHFRLPLYSYWCGKLREEPRFHRKQWEYVYICQVLHERGFLQSGRDGIGFGVGREPLPAYFVNRGARILASDQDLESAKKGGWSDTNQHSADLEAINDRGICDPELLRRNTVFRAVDMNEIPDDLGKFDFCWSSCAFEHLGSIRKGLDFVVNSARLLKPGGVAVHTTEYNVLSNDETLDNHPAFVIFRRRDLEQMVEMLRGEGYVVEPIDFWCGEDQLEQYVDLPPYLEEPHLRLELANKFVSTSVGFVVHAPLR